MSWCGGGEIRPTPGVEWRARSPRHLVPGELPAFARLRALRHLDLQLLREGCVLRRDAEAAGATCLIRELRSCEAFAVFAALSGVGTRA
jgi:hypothetical protein